MRTRRWFILAMWVVVGKAAAMTVEQRQQFVYYFYEAERLWQAEQYADAFALFDFCYALNPDDAMTNRYLGHIYRGSQLVPQSLPFYRRAWEAAPEECWNDYAVTLYNNGSAAQKAEAIRVMEQAGTSLPDDPDVWDRLRDAYIGVGQYKQAIHAQDQLDRVEGYSPYSAINRYRIYMMAQDTKKAIKAIEDYLQEDPTNVQFQLYRMQLYEMTGRPAKQLVPIYQTILKLDPYNALVLNNYAYQLATTKKGDLRLAEQMSAKAVQAEPNNPTYLDTYAWILYLTGQQTLAQLYMRQAISKLDGNGIPTEMLKHYDIIVEGETK
ncbi:MAG: tetratricopeptide repeat protein [Paludibacteraceae bacterium]|nr:tetratricopeptide repeat protein [Paludibacteraceae bacterium]